MNITTIKPILIGMLLGAALFILPFFVARVLLVFMIIGAVLRFLRGRRLRRRHQHRELPPAVADIIRDMSEQEYKLYRQKLEEHYYGYGSRKVK